MNDFFHTNSKKRINHEIMDLLLNKELRIDGYRLLSLIPKGVIKVCFFDPQYRGILDRQKYGNEGVIKEKRRMKLKQMNEDTITRFIEIISEKIVPSGHLFLWIDKYHLCEGTKGWFSQKVLVVVDLIVWDKIKIGLGYRSRRRCEYLLVLQKRPLRAKGVWKIRNIPDIWTEKANRRKHVHSKPVKLQEALICAVSEKGDLVLDPAMGGGSVLEACINTQRNFIGGDIEGKVCIDKILKNKNTGS